MRRATIIFAIIVVLAAFIGFRWMLRRGFSAHDEPTRIETMVARRMRNWAVPAGLRGKKTPVPLTPAILADARAHFADHCAACHGNDGKGSDLGRRMYPKAPDMTLEATQNLSDGELFATIENGVRLTGMPGFGTGTAESAHGSWTLVHFIRHLPKLTPEEIAAMEQLNPKSPEEWRELQEEEAFLSGGEPPASAPSDSHGHHH